MDYGNGELPIIPLGDVNALSNAVDLIQDAPSGTDAKVFVWCVRDAFQAFQDTDCSFLNQVFIASGGVTQKRSQ